MLQCENDLSDSLKYMYIFFISINNRVEIQDLKMVIYIYIYINKAIFKSYTCIYTYTYIYFLYLDLSFKITGSSLLFRFFKLISTGYFTIGLSSLIVYFFLYNSKMEDYKSRSKSLKERLVLKYRHAEVA